jgi:hypothetical protein
MIPALNLLKPLGIPALPEIDWASGYRINKL